jgi:hypothetical protein
MPNFTPNTLEWYKEKIQIPGPESINTGLSSLRVSDAYLYLGRPRFPLSQSCKNSQVSDKIKSQIVTMNVGPFRLTGFKPFLLLVEKVFKKIKDNHPVLYASMHTAGCLCVRYVRGSGSSPSNHSWGCAFDCGVKAIDVRGDGMCQRGLLILYSYMKHEKIYWGAEFGTEDSMHFEASLQLVKEWRSTGII